MIKIEESSKLLVMCCSFFPVCLHILLQVEDHLLIAEVGPDGKGRKDIVTSLIEKV